MGICVEPGCPKHRPCPTHESKAGHWSPGRDRAKQAAFRRKVLARDRWTCQDCGKRDKAGKTLRACHLVPLAEGGSYELSNGRTRCEHCDKATDPHAR